MLIVDRYRDSTGQSGEEGMQRPNRKEHLKRVLTLERSRRALSQEEVAEAIGVSTRNYQRWEQGLT
ncbi:MAG TPA: helix-turn-helix transcriptional regulator, partial [Ktedonobacteraceae bacterium]|nr:helix-turn-helix transcriptional regulator [Ktedonobacteraceae bacterium]